MELAKCLLHPNSAPLMNFIQEASSNIMMAQMMQSQLSGRNPFSFSGGMGSGNVTGSTILEHHTTICSIAFHHANIGSHLMGIKLIGFMKVILRWMRLIKLIEFMKVIMRFI